MRFVSLITGAALLVLLVGLSAWSLTKGGSILPDVQRVDVGQGALPPFGEEIAPVRIIFFGDLGSELSNRYLAEMLPKLERDYIATGNVVLYWRDFATLSARSFEAAEAVRCIAEQGEVWPYLGVLSRDSSVDLSAAARAVGTSDEEFGSCRESDRYVSVVSEDAREGRGAGVQAVPTLFINGRKVSGMVPYEILSGIIDEELRRREE